MDILFFLLFWSCIAQVIAFRRKFYSLSSLKNGSSFISPYLSNKQVLTSFGIYLIFIAATFITFFFLHKKMVVTITLLSGIQCLCFLLCFFAIFSFLSLSSEKKKTMSLLWKSSSPYVPSRSWKQDFLEGCLTWLLAFPIATLIGELLDLFVSSYFQLPPYEQVAVMFLKSAATSSLSLFFALCTLILIVPCLEELLFRGALQTYLRGVLGPKPAILISALCFSLAHFAISQHLGNISLLFSLFILGCYLGLLYEKNRSLWASIGLHFAFNTISAFRIILFQ